MYAILVSALNTILGFFTKHATVKFFIFTAIFLFISGAVPFMASKLPSASLLSNPLALIPPSLWYWLEPFQLSKGLNLILSAYASRFSFRRLPMLG